MPKKTSIERLLALKERQERLRTQVAALEARTKEQQRREDTRRKIIVGGAVLAHAALHPEFARTLHEVLKVAVTRDIDKNAVADLLESPAAVSPPR